MPRLNGLVGCLLATITLLWQQSALSQETRWTHFGVRPLAMGNAFVAVSDDFNALFYNPAGLARLKEWDFEILNLKGTASKNTGDLVKDVMEMAGGQNETTAGGSSGSSSSNETKEVLGLFDTSSGEHQYVGLGLTPHFIMKHFGVGIGLDFEASMVFHRYPSVEVDIGPQAVIPIAMAFNFLEDRLSVGVGVKYRVKAGVDHEISIQDIEALKSTTKEEGQPSLEDYVEGGSGIGADVGILFTPVKTMEPTLGVSITDIGGTPYATKLDLAGVAVGTPDMQLPSVNIGLSLKPLQAGRLYLLTAVDMHSVNLPYSFSKKFNLGTELGIGSIIKIQAGLHQGYVSGGVQFDVGLLALRLATYAEEMGSVAGTNGDRRYAFQIKLLI